MIKLVVSCLVFFTLINLSHETQEVDEEEIFKRFNNAHLLRGRRSSFGEEEEMEKRFNTNGHLLRGRRAMSANHFLRGRKSSANHFLRGRKFDRNIRALVNHLFRGKRRSASSGDLRFLDEMIQDSPNSYLKYLLQGLGEDPELKK